MLFGQRNNRFSRNYGDGIVAQFSDMSGGSYACNPISDNDDMFVLAGDDDLFWFG